MDEVFNSPLQAQLYRLLDRRKQNSRLRTLKASPHGSVDFSSNDFLSLSTSTPLRQSFCNELNSIYQLGSTGSRLLDGNSSYAERLELDIAAFHRGPAGLLVNSGYDANVGIFSCLLQPGDIVFYDELIHASVHDGIKASRVGRATAFAHNSMVDLRRVLEEAVLVAPGGPSRNFFIAVESVYSMDGDLAPLTEIVHLVDMLFPGKNAHIVVDEAHATGIYGENGRGRVCELGLEDKIFIRLHTFGKALACNGAIIICTPLTRQYLINYARPLIYTTFMSFPALAMIKSVYSFMAQGETNALARDLVTRTEMLYSRLQELRDPCGQSDVLEIPADCPKSPIISLLTSAPRELAQHCQKAGYVVRAIVAPTVPEGFERVRVCMHSGNTLGQIEGLVQVLQQWIEKEKLIKVVLPQGPRARL